MRRGYRLFREVVGVSICGRKPSAAVTGRLSIFVSVLYARPWRRSCAPRVGEDNAMSLWAPERGCGWLESVVVPKGVCTL